MKVVTLPFVVAGSLTAGHLLPAGPHPYVVDSPYDDPHCRWEYRE